MAGAGDTDKASRSGTPAKPTAPEAPAPDAAGDGTLSADERKARLRRAVTNLTREARAEIRSEGEFEALLVRGEPVNHRVHLVAVVVMAVLAVVVSQGLHSGLAGLGRALVVPGVYALFWLFLAVTGGEELDRISVDEQGKVHSEKSGRDVEARGDFLRVAIPVVVIAVTGWNAVSVIRDIAFPPPPKCNVEQRWWPDACFTLPNLAELTNATLAPAPTASPSPSASETPGASPAADAGINGALSVEETKTLERLVRVFFLLVTLAFLLPAIWFLWRMLTGRWVWFIRPVRHRLGDE
ncbi:MAG: hypothetical protein ABSB75_01485 [Candidatus Limnocylindrales bacterium]